MRDLSRPISRLEERLGKLPPGIRDGGLLAMLNAKLPKKAVTFIRQLLNKKVWPRQRLTKEARLESSELPPPPAPPRIRLAGLLRLAPTCTIVRCIRAALRWLRVDGRRMLLKRCGNELRRIRQVYRDRCPKGEHTDHFVTTLFQTTLECRFFLACITPAQKELLYTELAGLQQAVAADPWLRSEPPGARLVAGNLTAFLDANLPIEAWARFAASLNAVYKNQTKKKYSAAKNRTDRAEKPSTMNARIAKIVRKCIDRIGRVAESVREDWASRPWSKFPEQYRLVVWYIRSRASAGFARLRTELGLTEAEWNCLSADIERRLA